MEQRFALVISYLRKQPYLATGGCFFNVYFLSAFCLILMIVTMILTIVTTIPAMLTSKFNISFVPFVVFSNMYHPLTIHISGKFSKCTHFGERRTADRFGSTLIIISQQYMLFNNYFIVYLSIDRLRIPKQYPKFLHLLARIYRLTPQQKESLLAFLNSFE